MNLPAGEYTLSYSETLIGGFHFLVVSGKEDGITRGVLRVNANDDASTNKDALICVREGNTLVVRALKMPSIRTSARFAVPYGAKLVAQNRRHNSYTQLAKAPMVTERIPTMLNAK